MELTKANNQLKSLINFYNNTNSRELKLQALELINKIKSDIATDNLDDFECNSLSSVDIFFNNLKVVKQEEMTKEEIFVEVIENKALEFELIEIQKYLQNKFKTLDFEYVISKDSVLIIAKDAYAKTYDLKESLKKEYFKFNFDKKVWQLKLTIKKIDTTKYTEMLTQDNVEFELTDTELKIFANKHFRTSRNFVFNFTNEMWIAKTYTVLYN